MTARGTRPGVAPFGIAAVAGLAIVVIDNFASGGEVSPIVIVFMLFAAGLAFGVAWGRRAWRATCVTTLMVPAAHVVKHVAGMPDTLQPNTYFSILMLAAFTLAVALIGTAIGIAAGRALHGRR